MIQRLATTLAVVATAAVLAVAATATAQPVPRFATPTTSTTAVDSGPAPPPPTIAPVIVSPTTSTTTTTTTTTTVPTEPPIATPTVPPTVVPTEPPIVTATPDASTSPPLAAATTTTEPADEVILGEIDISGEVPDGLDLSAFPDAPTGGPAAGGGPQLAAGFSCAYQCIKSGVAHPRGFGALLVVETHVPARLFISIVDEDNDYVDSVDTGLETTYGWDVDHLEPGATYYVIVAATDENDDTAYAYGEFLTLSERTITIWVGSPEIVGGPTNIIDTDVYVRAADLSYHGPATAPVELVYYSLPRHLDLGVHVFRFWETSWWTLCEGHGVGEPSTYGNSDDQCGTWNTATVSGIDTDAIPDGESQWTAVEISRLLTTGDGVAPPGAGPRYFDFHVWVTITVEYR